MLKITGQPETERDAMSLQLEGRLAGRWVEELEVYCSAMALNRQRCSMIDLTGVTYSAPICLRNNSSSSVGLAPDCAQSLIPGAPGFTTAELFRETATQAPRIVPPRTILPKSLRLAMLILALSDSAVEDSWSMSS